MWTYHKNTVTLLKEIISSLQSNKKRNLGKGDFRK